MNTGKVPPQAGRIDRIREGILRLVQAVTVVALTAFVVGACGGGDPEPPTSVTTEDLARSGEFWNSLTPDLKDELIDMAKEEAAAAHPPGAFGIRATDTGTLVREVDKEYANEAKQEVSIYDTYNGASAGLARERFDDAMNQIDQLGVNP
jgi:hypothetical protein